MADDGWRYPVFLSDPYFSIDLGLGGERRTSESDALCYYGSGGI